MKCWSERFLQSVCQPAVVAMIEDIQPICPDFNAKLKRLKANIISSDLMDREEFWDISWDSMIDKKTEYKFLQKIEKALDVMSLTPMGRNILSGIYTGTYFGVAPIRQTGQFFNRNTSTVFLRAKDDIFQNSKLILKVLTHECTHSKNARVADNARAYMLPPKLYFMHQMMNELTAYLSEDIVVAQKKDENITSASQTQEHLFDVLERIVDAGYVADFSHRVRKWYKTDVLAPDTQKPSKLHLALFASYFKEYPVLRDLVLINRLSQLYNYHVIKKTRRQMPVSNQKIR